MASEAADNLGNIKKRDHYLALANEQNHAKLAVELTRAKQQVNDGHISLGLKTLQSLQPDAPNNPILLNLLKRCYITLHRWQQWNGISIASAEGNKVASKIFE